MDRPICVSVLVVVAEGRESEFLEVMRQDAIESRKEPGCMCFHVSAAPDPRTYMFYEVYADGDAVARGEPRGGERRGDARGDAERRGRADRGRRASEARDVDAGRGSRRGILPDRDRAERERERVSGRAPARAPARRETNRSGGSRGTRGIFLKQSNVRLGFRALPFFFALASSTRSFFS